MSAQELVLSGVVCTNKANLAKPYLASRVCSAGLPYSFTTTIVRLAVGQSAVG